MMSKRLGSKIVFLCGVLLIGLALTRSLEAHAGGTPRIVNEPAGDFVGVTVETTKGPWPGNRPGDQFEETLSTMD